MNEEDTFRKLKRINFADLESLINYMDPAVFDAMVLDKGKKKEFLHLHGWTVEEFNRAARELYK